MQPDAPPGSALATAGDRLSPRRSAAPRDVLLNGAWIASALMIIGAAAAACVWRGDVTAAWPPAAHILGTASRGAIVAQANTASNAPQRYTSSDPRTTVSARPD
jgi:hypothetical protein